MTDTTDPITTPQVELLPCPVPWCKSHGFDGEQRPYTRMIEKHFRVECPECPVVSRLYKTKAEAIAAWNTRPSASLSPTEMVEALKECAEVLRRLCPRIPHDGPRNAEEQYEYETIGGAFYRAEKALAALSLPTHDGERERIVPYPNDGGLKEPVRELGEGGSAFDVIKDHFERGDHLAPPQEKG